MIAKIPVMVKSVLCNLHNTSSIESLDIYHDDPTDLGGYFLLNDHDYVVSSTESVLYNYLHLRKKDKKGIIVNGMIISREHETGFGNSY